MDEDFPIMMQKPSEDAEGFLLLRFCLVIFLKSYALHV
jgi:hypothetical protein